MSKNFSQLTEEFSQNQETAWLSLEVTQQADGAFVGYESVTGTRCEGGWDKVRRWIDYLLADTEDAIKGEGAG